MGGEIYATGKEIVIIADARDLGLDENGWISFVRIDAAFRKRYPILTQGLVWSHRPIQVREKPFRIQTHWKIERHKLSC